MRIFQLAKELDVSSQEITDALDDMGVQVKSNLASIDDALVAELRELFKPKPKTARKSTKKAVVQRALAEQAEREEAAAEAARREAERKEKARKAVLAKAAAKRAEQRRAQERDKEFAREHAARTERPSAPAPPPPAPPPAMTEEPAAAPPAETQQPAAPAARSTGPRVAARDAERHSTLGKAVIAPPPTSAKERAQLLGRPLGSPRPGRPAPTRGARPARPEPRAPRAPLSDRAQRRSARKGGAQRSDSSRQDAVATISRPAEEPVGTIRISEGITIKDLAERMERKAKDVIKRLFLDKGLMATINHALDEETATWVVEAFGGTVEVVGLDEEAAIAGIDAASPAEDAASLTPRAPVVTMMGHVDHGKTSLLDAIRESRVAEREAGGITQHIGAYRVTHSHEGREKDIVFLDTPGHEAFTLMRARGARVTDIVVIVVAADDGVMPQTLEAINHAKAAEVPVVVAVNKIDKAGANQDRVLQQLAERGLMVEQFGGQVVACPVSAKTREGLDHLLEMILLVGDMQELTANADRPATGTVLEAKLDRARGPVATVLIQSGTLRRGDVFVVGSTMGRVRALFDEHEQPLEECGPSSPAVVLGLEDVPAAGDVLQVFPDEQKARQLATYRQQKQRDEEQARRMKLPSVERLFEQIREGEVNELPIVVKADVAGSVETLQRALTELSTDEVRVNVIHSGTGAITETDILLASASRAIVVGFNVRPERGVAEIAGREGVDIRLHTVIYNVADEIKQAMLATLSPVEKEVALGRAEVRETFRIPKIGLIAGCMVSEGLIRRDASVRVLRDNVVIHEGKIASLRRFKDDAKEVRSGFECGIGLDRFQDIKPGDELEAFTVELTRRETLEPNPAT